ncbi:MAG: SPOR domain-containing protein [Bacteroidota bacterium]
MAKKNPNEDPEEENKSNQPIDDSDEDFGLPDLEYEELEDDTDEEVLEEEQEEIVEEEVSEPVAEVEDDPIADEIGDIDSDVDDDLDIDTSDIDDETFEPTSFDIDDDDDDLDLGDIDDKDFDEKDFLDEEELSKTNIFDSDDDDEPDLSDFDADDLSDFEPPSEDAELPGSYRTVSSEEGAGKFTKIIVIGVVSFFIIAAALLFFDSMTGDPDANQEVVHIDKADSRPAKRPEAKPKPKPKPAAESNTGSTNTQTAEAKPKPKPAAAKPKPKPVAARPKPASTQPAYSGDPGDFQVLPERTGRSYVIIASFFDEDMATDYSEELSSNGVSTSIIPPFKDSKFYRVAIAEFATYGDAAGALSQFRGTYGDDVWALRY